MVELFMMMMIMIFGFQIYREGLKTSYQHGPSYIITLTYTI